MARSSRVALLGALAPPCNLSLPQLSFYSTLAGWLATNLGHISMTSRSMRLNGDVLRIIFCHVDNIQGKQRGRALVNAAMTCKDWYQPALCTIWRRLDDLFPLFELFSAFVTVRIVGPDEPYAEGVELCVSDPPF